MLRVLLIDDHAIVREGFKRLFEGAKGFLVVAEAANGTDALAAVRLHHPDFAVLDLSLGASESGLALLPQLVEAAPTMKCVVLSMHDDPGLVLRALDFGAHGYVTKATAADELVGVLQRVAVGETALSSDLARPSSRTGTVRLTQRERATLRGLLTDRAPKAIAADLGISDKTLYRHRANLMEKLGARTTADLARIARERGLLVELGQSDS